MRRLLRNQAESRFRALAKTKYLLAQCSPLKIKKHILKIQILPHGVNNKCCISTWIFMLEMEKFILLSRINQ